jgi:hypothetical protein
MLKEQNEIICDQIIPSRLALFIVEVIMVFCYDNNESNSCFYGLYGGPISLRSEKLLKIDWSYESLPQFSWIQLRHYATHARQSRLILIFLVRRHFFCVPLHKTRYCSSRFNPIKVETPPNNLDANQIKTSNVTHLMHFLHLHHQP